MLNNKIFALSLCCLLTACAATPSVPPTSSTRSSLNTLSEDDKALAQQATQNALENLLSGKTLRWRNPHTGNSGSVTPLRTYRIQSGHFCRQYRSDITTDNISNSAKNDACRDGDGLWKTI